MQTADVIEVISVSSENSGKSSMLFALDNHLMPEKKREVSKSPGVEIITLASQTTSSTNRYPVTWSSPVRKDNPNITYTNTHCTPSPTCKVTSWLQKNLGDMPPASSNSLGNPSAEHLPAFIRNMSSPLALLNKALESKFNSKSSILVRQDYKKQLEEDNSGDVVIDLVNVAKTAVRTGNNGSKIMNNNAVKEVCSKSKIAATQTNKQTVFVSSVANSTTQTVPVGKELPTTENNREGAIGELKTPTRMELKRKNKFISVPLSPESQKKNELCEYLKLMNMNTADGNVYVFGQNRRSSRVKHLALLSEKKELERQLNSEGSDSERKRCLKDSERSFRQSTDSNHTKVSRLESPRHTSPNSQLPRTSNHLETPPSASEASHDPESAQQQLNQSTQKKIGMEIRCRSLRASKDSRYGKQFPPLDKNKTLNKQNGKVLKEAVTKCNGSLKKELVKSRKVEPTPKTVIPESNMQKKKRPRRMTRLRNDGSLKTIDLYTILKRQEHKERIRKKIERKVKPPKANEPKKEVKQPPVVIRQEEQQTETKCIVNYKEETEQEKWNCSPLPLAVKKQEMLKLEQDLLDNLTPEHRRALTESKRFVKSPPKTEKNIDGTIEKKYQQECYNYEATKAALRQTTLGSMENILASETSRNSSEDAEVDRLMNHQINGHVAQKASSQKVSSSHTGPPSSTETTTPADLTSESSLYSHSSCSKRLHSEREPTPSSSLSKQIFTPTSYNSPRPTAKRKDGIMDCRNGFISPLSPTCQSRRPEIVNVSDIEPTTCNVQVCATDENEMKSLHQCLTQQKRKRPSPQPTATQNWDDGAGVEKPPKGGDRKGAQSHAIHVSVEHGPIINTFYLDYNLVLVQELAVSFWYQTPLGNVLGAPDMWISKGSVQRSILGNGCMHKGSSEMVISLEDSIAYVELWTKEHKSDKRERPVADIFVAIYLRMNRNKPEKKVLQLENIHGCASDVQYIVLRNSPNIVVSWSVTDGNNSSSTVIHCYQLSPDFQMVTSIQEVQSVDHYISSLHNIQDCDTLIMGCGDSKITLWNVEYCYIVATIDLEGIHPQPRTLYAKSDRGFLFTLHQLDDGLLQLIAINSFDSTWKKLHSYKSEYYDHLKHNKEITHQNLHGACMERGLVIAFYEMGVSCWRAGTGQLVFEDQYNEGIYAPFGNHVVIVLNNRVYVRHTLEYLVTSEDL